MQTITQSPIFQNQFVEGRNPSVIISKVTPQNLKSLVTIINELSTFKKVEVKNKNFGTIYFIHFRVLCYHINYTITWLRYSAFI